MTPPARSSRLQALSFVGVIFLVLAGTLSVGMSVPASNPASDNDLLAMRWRRREFVYFPRPAEAQPQDDPAIGAKAAAFRRYLDANASATATAIAELKASSDALYPPAMAELGLLHFRGRNVNQDSKLGRNLLEKAADLGEPRAHTIMGQIAMLGLYGEAKSSDVALDHLRQATERGDPAAFFWLASAQANTGDTLAAFTTLQSGADHGDPRCAFRMYDIIRRGSWNLFVKLDTADAKKYGEESLTKAADAGYPPAVLVVAETVFRRIGAGDDEKRSAERGLHVLADSGYAQAQFLLGTALMSGATGTVETDAGLHQLELAADQGYPAAQYYLGRYYVTRNPPGQGYSKGLDLLKRSSLGGYEDAGSLLSSLGEDVTLNVGALGK